jgi:tetratricopeptide (TPR) repeat protein
MTLPKTKTSAITAKINLLLKKASVSPFEVKSLQREIDTLKQIDAGEAYMLGGMLYSLVGDYEQSKLLHEKALKLSSTIVDYVNYAVSMKRLGRVTEALALYLKVTDINPADKHYVDNVLQLMTFSGDFEKFDYVLSRFKKSNPSFNFDEMSNVSIIESIREHLAKVGVPESEFKFAGSLVESVLIEYGYTAKQLFEKIGTFDTEQHVYVEMGIEAKSASDLVAINNKVAELIITSDQISCWDRLIYNIVSFHQPLNIEAA